MKSRAIGLLVITGAFFLTLSFVYGFTAQGTLFAGVVAGSILAAGLCAGPVLIFMERRISPRLAGFLAIFLFPGVTMFFYRLFSALVF